MSIQTWWLFVIMTFFVSATPGPNMIMVMSHGARFGMRATLSTMSGCMTALVAMMSLSAAGLGAILQAFPAVFDALRWAGAAYLAYLGLKIWRTSEHGEAMPVPMEGTGKSPEAGHLYRQGLFVAASNPKALLFAAAFFPQFIRPELPQVPQFGILLATFSVIEVGWYFVYASSGYRLAAYLRRATVLKVFNRVTGSAFIGFAAAMAAGRN